MPNSGQTTVLQLGLAPLAPADWIQCDADFSVFQQHKVDTQNRFADKVSAVSSSSATTVFAEFLLANLQKYHAGIYRFTEDTLIHKPSGLNWSLHDRSLPMVCRWIQEDICILEPDDGIYKLTAASVCSPSNWRLEDKIGHSIDSIHTPVPGYHTALSTRVNRLLTKLPSSKPLCRYNWSIQYGNELLWRDDLSTGTVEDSIDVKSLYWRIERQSLLRIPQTGLIIFSIRIYLHCFADLVKMPGFSVNLQAILGKLPAAQCAYKGLLDKKF